MLTPRNELQTVITCRNGQKWPNSPGEGTRWAPDKPNSFYSHTDALSAWTGVQSIAHETITPADEAESIKTAQNRETHLMGMKSQCPSPPINGERSALDMERYTYHGTCQSKH